MAMKRKMLGAQIVDGLKEAVAFERGELRGVRVRRVPLTARVAEASPTPAYDGARVRRIREALDLSQPVFAQALNVSPETVKSWEQGKRAPDGAARRLLQLTEQHPQWLLSTVRPARRSRGRATG